MPKPYSTFHDVARHYCNSEIYFSQVSAGRIGTLAPSGGHFDGVPQGAQQGYYTEDELAWIKSIHRIYVKQMI